MRSIVFVVGLHLIFMKQKGITIGERSINIIIARFITENIDVLLLLVNSSGSTIISVIMSILS